MKKINLNIIETKSMLPCGHTVDEGCGCDATEPEPHAAAPKMHSNAHTGEEGRMHRTSLAQLHAYSLHLLDMIDDSDDLPEWVESKITKATDYINSVRNYLNGELARDKGALEEEVTDAEEQQLKKIKIQLKKASDMHKAQSKKIDDIIDEGVCDIDVHHDLYEAVQTAVDEFGDNPCPQCLYEVLSDASCGCPDLIPEAKYKGKDVVLNKPKRYKKGSSKSKFYVYVKGCAKDKSRVTKVSFGDPNMKIKKSNPKRRKSFRARHKCATAKDKCKARYWSCKKW